MRRLRAWRERAKARRRQRRRMDALIESIERKTPALGYPDVDLLPGETWDAFVARMDRFHT